MKTLKRPLLMLLIATMAISMSVQVFADDSSSVSAPGYGTLYGSITVSTLDYYTSVTYNNDNAQLGITGVIKDVQGNDVSVTGFLLSDRGATNFSWGWLYLPQGSYSMFGAHEVRNGRTYGAAVVYTYTRV